MESNHHEMNLFDLLAAFFRRIGRFFKALVSMCGNSFRLSVWRWYIVYPILCLGIAGAIYWSRPDNRIYKVGAIVKLNGPTVDDAKQVWQPLQFATPHCISSDQSIANLLGITDAEAASVERFACFNVIDCLNDSIADYIDFKGKHDLTDTMNVVMKNHLYLQFRTKCPEQAQKIGEAVLSYMNGNKALQSTYSAYHATLQREAEFCHTQIEKLDSLTTSFYFEQGIGQQIQRSWAASALVVGERELNLLHPEILELIQYTKKADKELSTATAPVVLEAAFTVDPRPVNGRLKCLFIGLIAGYIAGCMLAWAIERRKSIGSWLKHS
ncbi:MAG: hypothetical protein NC038_03785 [Paludibacter sp.]|nr:hypothetical protein [Bacteroidales bacterium]MCM1069199.1 hypothetical protein [Prevotella sp.]MCM1354104.1 hypothetical protein [Bacteroides sp.]MCM1442923.1 hypothetical protein [Muribaculum sp.]MCM1481754.1 hypothetical protein [Paludibacter sp.]